jgi:hypothetical protein
LSPKTWSEILRCSRCCAFSDCFEFFLQISGVKLCVFRESNELNLSLLAKTRSKTVRFQQYTVCSDKKRNYAFSVNAV